MDLIVSLFYCYGTKFGDSTYNGRKKVLPKVVLFSRYTVYPVRQMEELGGMKGRITVACPNSRRISRVMGKAKTTATRYLWISSILTGSKGLSYLLIDPLINTLVLVGVLKSRKSQSWAATLPSAAAIIMLFGVPRLSHFKMTTISLEALLSPIYIAPRNAFMGSIIIRNKRAAILKKTTWLRSPAAPRAPCSLESGQKKISFRRRQLLPEVFVPCFDILVNHFGT